MTAGTSTDTGERRQTMQLSGTEPMDWHCSIIQRPVGVFPREPTQRRMRDSNPRGLAPTPPHQELTVPDAPNPGRAHRTVGLRYAWPAPPAPEPCAKRRCVHRKRCSRRRQRCCPSPRSKCRAPVSGAPTQGRSAGFPKISARTATDSGWGVEMTVVPSVGGWSDTCVGLGGQKRSLTGRAGPRC